MRLLKNGDKKDMKEVIRTALYSAECFFPKKDYVKRF